MDLRLKFYENQYNSQERMKWIFASVCLSNMLSIRYRQILFCQCLTGNFTGEVLRILPDLDFRKE